MTAPDCSLYLSLSLAFWCHYTLVILDVAPKYSHCSRMVMLGCLFSEAGNMNIMKTTTWHVFFVSFGLFHIDFFSIVISPVCRRKPLEGAATHHTSFTKLSSVSRPYAVWKACFTWLKMPWADKAFKHSLWNPVTLNIEAIIQYQSQYKSMTKMINWRLYASC